jgi:hypothetical protein
VNSGTSQWPTSDDQIALIFTPSGCTLVERRGHRAVVGLAAEVEAVDPTVADVLHADVGRAKSSSSESLLAIRRSRCQRHAEAQIVDAALQYPRCRQRSRSTSLLPAIVRTAWRLRFSSGRPGGCRRAEPSHATFSATRSPGSGA